MKTYRGILGTVMLAAVLGTKAAAAASPAPCNMLLTVELTPDVPNARSRSRGARGHGRHWSDPDYEDWLHGARSPMRGREDGEGRYLIRSEISGILGQLVYRAR
jgi:hypothetical protein